MYATSLPTICQEETYAVCVTIIGTTMTAAQNHTTAQRTPLNRERVLRAAIALADSDGIDAVTMRRLGRTLGVEAMSLYNHVANKDDLLDGVVGTLVSDVDARVGELPPASERDDWKRVMRERILTARTVLLEHPWAPALIESRAGMPPTVISYFDRLLGIMVAGGFSHDLAHHALHVLGSRALGFTQELFNPGDEDSNQVTRAMIDGMARDYPNISAMLAVISHDDPGSTFGWCDDQTEFVFGLDLILDGLDRKRLAER